MYIQLFSSHKWLIYDWFILSNREESEINHGDQSLVALQDNCTNIFWRWCEWNCFSGWERGCRTNRQLKEMNSCWLVNEEWIQNVATYATQLQKSSPQVASNLYNSPIFSFSYPVCPWMKNVKATFSQTVDWVHLVVLSLRWITSWPGLVLCVLFIWTSTCSVFQVMKQ